MCTTIESNIRICFVLEVPFKLALHNSLKKKIKKIYWKLEVTPLKIYDFFLWMVTTASGLGSMLQSWLQGRGLNSW